MLLSKPQKAGVAAVVALYRHLLHLSFLQKVFKWPQFSSSLQATSSMWPQSSSSALTTPMHFGRHLQGPQLGTAGSKLV